MNEDLDNTWLYRDKELQTLDKAISQCVGILKNIKSRNELKDVVTVSTNVFNSQLLESYKKNHPDLLLQYRCGDVVMKGEKTENGCYRIILVGSDICPLGFTPVDDMPRVFYSTCNVRNYESLETLFQESLKHLIYKEVVPFELF